MSTKEIDRGELIRRVREKRLTQAKAAALMRLSVRQVKRLCRLFKDNGLAGLASRQRGQPSNRKDSHPLDDIPNFMNSSHDSLLSDQPFLVALFRLHA